MGWYEISGFLYCGLQGRNFKLWFLFSTLSTPFPVIEFESVFRGSLILMIFARSFTRLPQHRFYVFFSEMWLVYTREHMKDHKFELRRKIWRHNWLSQLYTQFTHASSCEIKAWKKFRLQLHKEWRIVLIRCDLSTMGQPKMSRDIDGYVK